jgi:hypothetical protein
VPHVSAQVLLRSSNPRSVPCRCTLTDSHRRPFRHPGFPSPS